MINQSKTALFVSAILVTTPLFAQTNTTQPVKQSPAYGDNPNIFVVLGHKTKEKVETTFSKIGNATERGINKIKPAAQKTADIAEYSAEKTVDKTIDKTTTFAEKTKDFAEQTVEKTTTGIENTTKKAKEAVLGDPNVKAPVENHELSQSSKSEEVVIVTPVVVETPVIINDNVTEINTTPSTATNDDSSSIPK